MLCLGPSPLFFFLFKFSTSGPSLFFLFCVLYTREWQWIISTDVDVVGAVYSHGRNKLFSLAYFVFPPPENKQTNKRLFYIPLEQWGVRVSGI